MGWSPVWLAMRFAAAIPIALVLPACETREPAPVTFAFSPDATRTGRLFSVMERYCLDPLPETGRLRARIAGTGWSEIPADEYRDLMQLGYEEHVIERKGEIEGLDFLISVYRGNQFGVPVVGCSVLSSGIEADAFERMLAGAGHIAGDPLIDMTLAPTRLRSWTLQNGPTADPAFVVSVETDDETGLVTASVSQ